jgi:hypothetical protein
MIASSMVSNSNLVSAHVHRVVIACLCGTIPGLVSGILLSRWNEFIRSWKPAYIWLIYVFGIAFAALIVYWKPMVTQAVTNSRLQNVLGLLISMMAVSISWTFCQVNQDPGSILGFAVYMPLPFLFWTLQISYCNWKQILWRPFNLTFWMVSLVLSFLCRVLNEQVATGSIQMEWIWKHTVDIWDYIWFWHIWLCHLMVSIRRHSQPEPEPKDMVIDNSQAI